jgi:glycosyltransferase involved in cell wall biosynthesis
MNLIASLQRVRSVNDYHFTVPSGVGYEDIAYLPGATTVYYRHRNGLLGRWCFDRFRLPTLLADFKPDLMLCLGNRGAAYHECPVAILCHDPHLFYPERHYANETRFKKVVKAFQRLILAYDLRSAKLLLCQTQTAAKRIREVFDYHGPIALCPNAVSQAVELSAASRQMPASLQFLHGKQKLFCLTRYYPHKNLELILDLFSRFGGELADTVVIVTIAADQHPKAARFLRDVKARRLEDRILNVGPLPQSDLPAYFHHCDALFLPTLLESFSGTYLEAMRFGKPILTSDLDFAHDVCGAAALYFNPWNVSTAKTAILSLQRDPDSATRLGHAGAERLKSLFRSWDDIAVEVAEHLEVLPTGGP